MRCFTEKKDFTAMGTALDIQRRQKLRTDDTITRSRIDMTRRWIFEKGFPVGCKAINDILETQSLLPVRVCNLLYWSELII